MKAEIRSSMLNKDLANSCERYCRDCFVFPKNSYISIKVLTLVSAIIEIHTRLLYAILSPVDSNLFHLSVLLLVTRDTKKQMGSRKPLKSADVSAT
jgi:hypothetical protein